MALPIKMDRCPKRSVAFMMFLCLPITVLILMNPVSLISPIRHKEMTKSKDFRWEHVGWKRPQIPKANLRPTHNKPVRILCFIPMSPNNDERLTAVRDTWGKRCDKMLFFSSETNRNQTVIGLNVTEGYDFLWGKVKAAFEYVYEHHINDADWFLKADDDTYVVLENLRNMLEREDMTQLIYYGRRLKNPNNINQSHMDGGAGYVISKSVLKKLVEIGMKNASLCSQRQRGSEDVVMSQCLERLGVSYGDSRDEYGKQRFFRFPLQGYFSRAVPENLRKIEYYPTAEGKECCSDGLVSVHRVSIPNMYLLDYLLYKVRPQSEHC
ncbi:glycoprotein-N-acetylgalactosamine 3-beta-galactosyltransferase 1-like [Ptychodera flava]|uniref:glycoprotein-N-acetylgalactosamine 3-beta-galactosyltransferase 1-like n=1 Tax=Ptychodera flava TaxID=63121 RepID=UPI003969F27A